jgi:hypothetical protein
LRVWGAGVEVGPLFSIDEWSKVRDGGRADLASAVLLLRARSCEGGSIAGLAERKKVRGRDKGEKMARRQLARSALEAVGRI